MIAYEKINDDENLPIKLIKLGGHDKGNSEVAKHWHDNIEIIYPHIGTCSMWIEGKKRLINENQIYIVNSKYVHGFDEVPKEYFYHGYVLQINYEYIKAMYPQIDSYLFNQPLGSEAEQLKEYIVNIVSEYENENEFKSIKVQSYLLSLVFILLNNLSTRQITTYDKKSEKNKRRILKIVNYIDKHYQEELSLESIADKFNLSQGHLTRIFNENVNSSVMNYVVLQRLKGARREMLESDLPLVDIAIGNGFSSLKSFTRAFKKEFGIVPREYRKTLVK